MIVRKSLSVIPTRSVAAALLSYGTEKYPIVPVHLDTKMNNSWLRTFYRDMVESLLKDSNYVGLMDAKDDFRFYRKEVLHPYGYPNTADSSSEYLAMFDADGHFIEELEIEVDMVYNIQDIDIFCEYQPLFSIRLEDFPLMRFTTYIDHVLYNQNKDSQGMGALLRKNQEGPLYKDEDTGEVFQVSELQTISPAEFNNAKKKAIEDFPYCMYKLIMLSAPVGISLLSMCFEYAYKESLNKSSGLDWKPAELMKRGRIYNVSSITGEPISSVSKPEDKVFRRAKDWVIEQLEDPTSPFSRYFHRMLECIKVLDLTLEDLDAKDYSLEFCYKLLDNNIIDDMCYYDRQNMFSRNINKEGIIKKVASLDAINNIDVIIDVIKRSSLSQLEKFNLFDYRRKQDQDPIVKLLVENIKRDAFHEYKGFNFRFVAGDLVPSRPSSIYAVRDINGEEYPVKAYRGDQEYYLTIAGKLMCYIPKLKAVRVVDLKTLEEELIRDEESSFA